MLQSVDIVPPAGVTWPSYSIPVLGQYPDLPFQIRKIDGLDPAAATINTTEGDQDDDLYLGSRVGKRNIVITLGLNYPVDSARGTLYTYFKTGGAVTLRFVEDGGGPLGAAPTPKVITGYVETIEDDHFAQDPEVVISIVCPKSDFLSESPLLRVDGMGVIGQGGAEPLTDTTDNTTQVPHVQYNGTKDGPFELVMDIGPDDYTGDVHIQHYNAGSGVPMREFILNDVTLQAGWQLYYSSLRGNKVVELRSVGTDPIIHKSLLWAMDNDSFWLSLFPGENTIKVVMPSEDFVNDFTVTVYERFGSIL